jgi:hypothetical protein
MLAQLLRYINLEEVDLVQALGELDEGAALTKNVIDLGVDVSPSMFEKAVKKHHPQFVGK